MCTGPTDGDDGDVDASIDRVLRVQRRAAPLAARMCQVRVRVYKKNTAAALACF